MNAIRRPGVRRWTTTSALVTAAMLAACATRPATSVHAGATPAALIIATPRYEVHLREGRVYELVPAETRDGSPTLRPIERAGEFRTLYEQATGHALPSAAADGSVEVNGWVNLACVRAAHACGKPPDGAPHAPVRLYFAF